MPDHDDAAHLNRDFLGYGQNPPDADWPGGARLAVNVCVNIEEGSEPSFPDGDGRSEGGLTESRASEFAVRDLATESMFEYGSRVGFWRILRILREHEVPATMFACALALERNAAISEAICEGPYDVSAHGWRWEHHVGVPEAVERERIARATKSITASVGKAPQGWYCRYGPSVNTRRLLVEHGGFLYDSDAYNDELQYWGKVGGTDHLVIPYSLVCNDAGFLRGTIASADTYFSLLRETFDMLYREGAKKPRMMSVGLHLRVAGHPARAVGLERFLDHVRKHPDVWLCRRADIARHWHERHPPKAS